MKKEEFVAHLALAPEQFEFQDKELDGTAGVLVENKYYQTKTFFSDEAVAAKELVHLLAATHQGRNIEHITRVTGYFSKVSGWNKGKIAELVDRHRTPIA